MERIKLTRQEKRILLGLHEHGGKIVMGYPPYEAARCVRSLQEKGLAKGAFVEGGTLEAAAITGDGESYIRRNPKLRNPIDWAKVSAVAAVLALLVGIIALFVACSRILRYI